MTIQERLIKCDQEFEAVKAQREEQQEIITTATAKSKELWDEMMRLQGEYRVLQALSEEDKTNKVATVINAEPEKEK